MGIWVIYLSQIREKNPRQLAKFAAIFLDFLS